MKNKTIRFLKALRYETVRRLPWVILLLFILGSFAAWKSYRKTAEGVKIARDNTTTLTRLGKDIKTLTEQNTELSKQNNRLAKENQANIACIAKLFAGFINNDGMVSGADIDNCRLILATSDSIGASSGEPSSTSAQIGSSSSSSKNTPNGSTKQPDNSQGGKSTQPTYTQCVAAKSGILGTVMGVVSCL